MMEKRCHNRSVALAKTITAMAGSMEFFYAHVIWFGTWLLMNSGFFGQMFIFDQFPHGLLTTIVSMEAIFLSTFCLIAQHSLEQDAENRERQMTEKLDQILLILKHNSQHKFN